MIYQIYVYINDDEKIKEKKTIEVRCGYQYTNVLGTNDRCSNTIEHYIR